MADETAASLGVLKGLKRDLQMVETMVVMMVDMKVVLMVQQRAELMVETMDLMVD